MKNYKTSQDYELLAKLMQTKPDIHCFIGKHHFIANYARNYSLKGNNLSWNCSKSEFMDKCKDNGLFFLVQQSPLEEYEQACQRLIEEFISRYYLDDEMTLEEYIESYTEFKHSTLFVCDDNVSLFTIEQAIKNNIPKDVYFKWYSDCLDAALDGRETVPNLENYYKKRG